MGEIDLIQRIQKLEHDVEMLRALEMRDLLLPMVNYQSLGSNISADTVIAGIALPRSPIYINRFQVNCLVSTTNNGSNYWTLHLVRTSDFVSLASANTSALAPSSSVFSRITGSIGTNMAAGEIGLHVQAVKTGSPGNLFVIGISVNAA